LPVSAIKPELIEHGFVSCKSHRLIEMASGIVAQSSQQSKACEPRILREINTYRHKSLADALASVSGYHMQFIEIEESSSWVELRYSCKHGESCRLIASEGNENPNAIGCQYIEVLQTDGRPWDAFSALSGRSG